MPFGLCNAAQTFQRFIDSIARDSDFAHVYIDRYFVLFTEHKPLTYALHTKSDLYCSLEVSSRWTVFDILNGLLPPGIAVSLRLVAARYVCPNMNKNVRVWAKQ